MFVHTVYFWLREGLSEEDLGQFCQGLETLRGVECVQNLHVGTPADTHRPVIDRSYSVGLAVVLPDKAAHDVYQEHNLHKTFLDNFQSFWDRVVIYDFD